MISTEDIKKQTEKDICSKHGDIQDMFCMDCEEQICLICGQQNHESHYWNRKTILLRRVKSEIEDECNHMQRENIAILKANRETLQTLRDENEKQFKENLENISTNTEHIVRVLKKLSLDLIGDCKSSQKKIEDEFEKQRNEGEKCISQFERCLEEFNTERKFVELMKLLQIKQEIQSIHCPMESSEISYGNRPDHIECMERNINENVLRSSLGCLYRIYNNVTVSKIYEAKKGTNVIMYISPISEYQAWFRELRSSEHVLINIRSDYTDTDVAGQIDSIPFDFITLQNGVSVYTWHTGHSVMKVCPVKIKDREMITNKVVQLADLSPLYPVGICATEDGRLLVSAIDTILARDTLVSPKKSAVIVLSKSGKTKKVFQYKNDGNTPLFLLPYKVAENFNGDVCVIDRVKMKHGQVVVLSSSGKLKFIYRGSGPEQLDFDPRGLCCDSARHILLSDYGTRSVHLLDRDGTFLTYLIKTDEEICSMSLYLNQLWIGGKNGMVSVYRYHVGDE